MVRSYEELKQLERIGLIQLLKEEGWNHCTLGDNPAMTKKIRDKEVTVKINDFNADED